MSHPAGRSAEKLAKELAVAKFVTLTGISSASVKRHRLELTLPVVPD